MQVPGLDFLGAEDLEDDPLDSNAQLYLMVPSEGALRNIVTLWRDWQRSGQVPYGYGPWKTMLSQLRDIRPWGPEDRITPADWEILDEAAGRGRPFVRVEIELVFRAEANAAAASGRAAVQAVGGQIVSESRVAGAGYHALLVDLPVTALRSALDRNAEGLAGAEAVLQIRPQSLFQPIPVEEMSGAEAIPPSPPVVAGDPIAAIFDAVPLSQHPRLAGTLRIEDPFDLTPLAVGRRVHGTAMASAVVHGDLNQPWDRPIVRPVHFVNMMYALADPSLPERFPDRLPADMFEQAIAGMKGGADPSAPHVIIVNASLGDKNKPFANRVSGWARVVDYLASRYGVLFVISAGNHTASLDTQGMTATQFEDLSSAERCKVALRASASQVATRRVLSPAEAINAVTVGALHADQLPPPPRLPAYTFDVWGGSGLCTVSSGLGPGYGGATKPDILAPGGRHHVRLAPDGEHHRLIPHDNAATFGGIAVASPPTATSLGSDNLSRSVGTSVAAALATGVAARAHEALETCYPDFVTLPDIQRAALLKALLVHGARWTHARDLLIEVLGPADNRQHYRQKDNVRRYLGFGAFDPELIINCGEDKATLWAVGSLLSDQGKSFSIPWPAAMSGKAQPHAVTATLAWFSPVRAGAVAYRAVRLKIVEPAQLAVAGIAGAKLQPDPKQAHKGTVVHRRWDGDKAAAIAGNGVFSLAIQREKDDLPDAATFALAVTVEMPGVAEIYAQVRSRVAVQPQIPIAPLSG